MFESIVNQIYHEISIKAALIMTIFCTTIYVLNKLFDLMNKTKSLLCGFILRTIQSQKKTA
jgi:hypothetical protein